MAHESREVVKRLEAGAAAVRLVPDPMQCHVLIQLRRHHKCHGAHPTLIDVSLPSLDFRTTLKVHRQGLHGVRIVEVILRGTRKCCRRLRDRGCQHVSFPAGFSHLRPRYTITINFPLDGFTCCAC